MNFKNIIFIALLATGVGLQACNEQATQDLFKAADQNDFNAAQQAIKAGADAASYYKWHNVLTWPCIKNNVPLVQLLIAANAQVNNKYLNGNTPLYYAVLHEAFDTMLVLLAAGACVNQKNDVKEKTVLHIAVSKNANIAQTLIAAKADVNAIDRDGNTPLHDTALSHATDIAKILINAFANVNAVNNQGNTPLHAAAEHCAVDIAKLLIEHDATVNTKNLQGSTPLHLAINPEITKALIIAKAHVNDTDSAGNTPLHLAVKNSKLKTTELLINADANVNAVNNTGNTPLHMATKEDIVNFLIQHKANVHAIDLQENTPLHQLIQSGPVDINVIQALIDAGAKVNAKNKLDQTPLSVAIGRYTPNDFAYQASCPHYVLGSDYAIELASTLIINGAETPMYLDDRDQKFLLEKAKEKANILKQAKSFNNGLPPTRCARWSKRELGL